MLILMYYNMEIYTLVMGLVGGAFVVWIILQKQKKILREEIQKITHTLKSAQVKFGKTFEHFVPFTKEFPSNKENFVFLGMPIDGVCFDEDTIKFLEFKTGEAQLSPKQRRIKQQVQEGKIEFKEVRY